MAYHGHLLVEVFSAKARSVVVVLVARSNIVALVVDVWDSTSCAVLLPSHNKNAFLALVLDLQSPKRQEH